MKYIIVGLIFCFSALLHAQTYYMPGFPNYQPITENVLEVPTQNPYPDVNVSGFIEMKVSGRDYTDDLNKLETIRQDEYYKKIPNDILKGSPKLENRYDIDAEGKLDKDTEVKFEILKEPDFPLVGNVFIKKNTSELQLGNFNSKYKSGEYVNLEKYLNGVEARTVQDKWTGQATIGKEKSEPQVYETFGNDTRKYKVGKSFLLEGSVRVFLNNSRLTENKDYFVNYYDGSVTFSRILTKVDYVKIIYEFTNPIQDFIPSLSRKNFSATTYTYNPSQNIKVDEYIVLNYLENKTIKDESQILSNRIELTQFPIKLGSELVYLNSKLLTRGTHYYLKNDSGLLRFTNKQLSFNDQLKVEYQYYKTKFNRELFFGNDTPGPYSLKNDHIIINSLEVFLNGQRARELIDYVYKENTNTVEFLYEVYSNMAIELKYKYKEVEKKDTEFKDAPYSFSITYLNESTILRDDRSKSEENISPIAIEGTNKNIIVLPKNPIDPDKPIQIMISGIEVDASNYTVNYYEGKITINNQSNLDINNIKINYFYIESINSEHTIRGLSLSEYTQDQIQFRSLPIKYQGISKITIFNPNETILEEGRDYSISYLNDASEFTDIRVSFIVGGFSILNSYPNSSDIIKFEYLYTPSTDDTQTDSTHEMTDVRIKKEMNKNWDLYGEIANTKYNFSKSTEYKKETFTQQQPDNQYNLQNFPIQDNSELIFINGFSQTKDLDYYINYEKGIVTFINKTIPDGQTIEIAYNYFLSNTPNQNNVNAYLIESIYSPSDNVEIKNKVNYIDPNFIPIGNIELTKGTAKISNEVNWKIGQNESASFLYESETIQNKNYQNVYEKDSYSSKLKFNALIFETTHQIRYDNIQSSQNFKETPKKIIQYQNDFSYLYDNNSLNLNNSLSQQNETISPGNYLNNFIAGSKLNYVNNYKIKNWIKNGNFSPYIGISLDKTNTQSTNNYSEKVIESMGFQTSTKFMDQIVNDNMFEKSIHKIYFIDNQRYIDTYYNYNNTSYISPYPWINTNISINHEESISPIPGQEDKVEDRQGYNIIRVANDAGLEYFGAPEYLYNIFKRSTSSLGYLKTNRRENNALKKYFEDRIFSNFNTFTPIEGLNIPNTKIDAYKSHLTDNKATTYQKFSESDTSFYSINSSFIYKPNINVLNRFNFDGSIKQSNSSLNSQLTLASGTSNTTESILFNDEKKLGINISPPNINLFLTQLGNILVRLEKNWIRTTDSNNTTSTDSNNNSFLINDSNITADKYQLSYLVLNQFRLSNNALNEQSFFNRNKLTNSQGSLFKEIKNLDQSIQWNVLALKNTEYVRFEVTKQYKNNQINVYPNEIETNYDNYLNLKERQAKHNTEWSINQTIALTGAIEGQDFNQIVASKNTSDKSQYFRQIKGTSGIIFRPLSGLNINYDYSIKQLDSNSTSNLRGYQDIVEILYSPIKYENFEVQFKFSRDKNWGFGFNTIENSQLLQTSNESLSIDIISRDDEVYLASLNLNMNFPINNSDHLESIRVTGEGYFKQVIDTINPENEIMINGLLFNVRLNL